MSCSRLAAFCSTIHWQTSRVGTRNARYYSCATSPTPAPPRVPKSSSIKLFACDMDGTILNTSCQITEENINAVQRLLKETDVIFVPATGKSRVGALRSMGRLGTTLRDIHPKGVPGVFCQGLVVYGMDGDIVFEAGVDLNVASRVTELAEALDLSLIAYSRDSILSNREDYFTDLLPTYHEPAVTAIHDWNSIISSGKQVINKFIFMAEPTRIDSIRPIVQEELGEDAHCTQAQSNMLEVLPKNTSKGDGLRRLLGAWNISPDEVLGIGDAENDVEMLKMVGLSCAMGNALNSVKQVSQVVDLPSNDESGVSAAIHRFVLT